ncbi:molybdate ABC transporter substrate-binding protein [Mucilaginibacter terrae]|uniref:Molybdate transport system substrate-binding protein n=1 Tax=Mucilaginibacter terrae TaxID=1955052 RepID=A0ABU3GTQ2_9SPHI|nr:molybdate ABC transporter substrate-binding protein [Mucilaginibacter terrae]MDT3403134.1 molybdate transport system substrate-binding protein [Mucilaginibacter terrae]
MKLTLFALTILLVPFCSNAQRLRIAAAANAQFVSQELVKEFKQLTGIEPELIIGSSGKFTAQIEQGAPFDIFMSADMKYPQELYEKQLTIGKPEVYAYGTLVLWSNTTIKLPVNNLIKADIRKIAVANPKLAPYGEATIQTLQKLKLYTQLQPKIVYGESIAQVNQYLLTGAVDVAFTAKSVVLDPAQKDKGSYTEIDSKLYKPIAQAVVILKSSTGGNLQQVKKFYKFLFSAQAKAIFKAYGYK